MPRAGHVQLPSVVAPPGEYRRSPPSTASRAWPAGELGHPRPRVAVTLAGLVPDCVTTSTSAAWRADNRPEPVLRDVAKGSNEYAAIAFSWVILLMTESSRWPSVSMTSSGANGQLLSECGKSDSQHSMSSLNQSMLCTPTLSLMKQV